MDQAVLIFNPMAGGTRKNRISSEDAMNALQLAGISPTLLLIEQGRDTRYAVLAELAKGQRQFVVCGGDGTVSPVAAALAGTDSVLAILPAGTRNNIARSCGIPEDLHEAALLLKKGRKSMIDMGLVQCESAAEKPFLELVSVGLASALTPPGDAARHGELAGVKDFLYTLFSSEPARIYMTIDSSEAMPHSGYAVIVTNMPYTGLSFQLGTDGCQQDGLLNVTDFADLSKLELLQHIATGVSAEKREDPRICHRMARTVDIRTEPPMPVMVDGEVIGNTPIHIEVRRRALAMVVP